MMKLNNNAFVRATIHFLVTLAECYIKIRLENVKEDEK